MGHAVFWGNTVRGVSALRDGDLQAAGEYLCRAGRTCGSPVLNSFGPDMTLAGLLLEAGARDAVLEFLELCRAKGLGDTGLFKWWADAMRAGETPSFAGHRTLDLQ